MPEILETAGRRVVVPETAGHRAAVLGAAGRQEMVLEMAAASRQAGMPGTAVVRAAADSRSRGVQEAVMRMEIRRLCRMAGVLLWNR